MIYEDLKKEFIRQQNLAWNSDRDSSKLEYRFEIERQVKIWDEMAEFMGYGVLKAPNLCRFIHFYFNRKFPSGKTYVETDEDLFVEVKDYDAFGDFIKKEYIKKYQIQWEPTLNFNHAKECENRLMKQGNYNKINLSKIFVDLDSGETTTEIIYSGSINNKKLLGRGRNELEAICDACINFMDRKRGKQMTLFDMKSLLKKDYILS